MNIKKMIGVLKEINEIEKSHELTEQIIDSKSLDCIKNKNYIIIGLSAKNEKKLSKMINKIVSEITKNNILVIEGIFNGLIYCTIMEKNSNFDFKSFKSDFFSNLISNFPEEIKIVHGTSNALEGQFGDDTYIQFSTILLNYEVILNQLVSMNYGEIQEIK